MTLWHEFHAQKGCAKTAGVNVLKHSIITLFVHVIIFLSDDFSGGGIAVQRMCRIDEVQRNKGSGCTSFAMSFCFDIVDSV